MGKNWKYVRKVDFSFCSEALFGHCVISQTGALWSNSRANKKRSVNKEKLFVTTALQFFGQIICYRGLGADKSHSFSDQIFFRHFPIFLKTGMYALYRDFGIFGLKYSFVWPGRFKK